MKPPRRDATSDVAALVERATPIVLAAVLAKLAGALGASLEAPYSTRRGHEPPEFAARQRFWRKTAPTIPGAVAMGRWWSVPRAAYAAWIAAKSARAVPAPMTSAAPASAEPWDARSALQRSGLRVTAERKTE